MRCNQQGQNPPTRQADAAKIRKFMRKTLSERWRSKPDEGAETCPFGRCLGAK